MSSSPTRVFSNSHLQDQLLNLILTKFSISTSWLLFTVQKALPLFQDGGSIILTASVGGSKGFEGVSVYAATKAAIRSFARSWTVDLKPRKIRVNAVSPGAIFTPMASSMGMGLSAEQFEQLKTSLGPRLFIIQLYNHPQLYSFRLVVPSYNCVMCTIASYYCIIVFR